jgi:TonB-linked SusC/RagA family outer membrane protein
MKKILLFFFVSLCFCVQLMAQDNVISGTVKDENSNPMQGVTVSVKGAKTVTTTDASGSFTIKANTGTTLVLTNVGYQSKEILVDGSKLDIAMVKDSRSMGEVVVTALGISKNKRNLTYSTQTVGVDEIAKARELNVVNSLAGKVAGMEISRSSSGLGGSSRVTLRGDRSITGNNQALIVVDGVPIDNSGGGSAQINTSGGSGNGRDFGDGISSINPDDIESINVLKGASATALYGSRAANGAIIITTKKGRVGKGIGVTYSTSYQVEQAIFLQEFQNEFGQGSAGVFNGASEFSWGPRLDGSQKPTWSKDPADAGKTLIYSPQPNNYKDFYSTGSNYVNSIALNGGTGKTQVYFSYTNTAAKGIVDNNKLKRHNVNLRLSNQFGEKLSLDAKVNYLNERIDNRQRTGDAFDNPNRHILRVPRNITTEDMMKYDYTNVSGFLRQNYWNPGSNGGHNPYWTKNRTLSEDERNRVIGFASLTYKLFPGINVMLRSGMDRYRDDVELKWYNDTYTIAASGNYQLAGRDVLETNNDFLFTLDKKISSDFTVNANLGGNIQKNKIVTSTTSNGALVVENLFITTNTLSSNTTTSLLQREKQSLYATADFGYKNFLTLTLTGRNDWSSTLPKENNSYFFPSVGVTAILSDIIKLPEFINFAKFRGSYAQTGNDADPYNLTQTYTSLPGGNGVTIGRDSRKPIPGLKPELTAAQELGLDLRFLNSRIGIEFTWYNSNSKNQLLPVTLPAPSGWTTEFVNAGNVENRGIEFMLTGSPIKTKNLKWDITVNYARNTNKVIEITPNLTEFVLTQGNDFMNSVRILKGKPFGELYSRGYSRDASGQILVDATGLPIITTAQTVYLGNTRPDWTGSIINKFSYKDFFLSFVINARMGGVVSSFTNANIYSDGVTTKTLAGRDGFIFDGVLANGTKNTVSTTAEAYWRKVGGRNSPAGEVFTYDASNIRLREAVIGYNIPKDLIKGLPFQAASVSLTGRNLFFLLNRAEGFDPELVVGSADRAVGIEAFSPPTTRSIGINLNLSF